MTVVIFWRTQAPHHGYGQSEVATALADGTWAALWPTLGLKMGGFAARQPTPQAPKAGSPGAWFKCGMHNHWARECTLQQSRSSQQSQPQWKPAGRFCVQGD